MRVGLRLRFRMKTLQQNRFTQRVRIKIRVRVRVMSSTKNSKTNSLS